MKVGGRAEVLLEPADPRELARAYVAAREWCDATPERELRVLGGGANLIVPDGTLAGVVIATDRMRRVFRPHEEQDDDPLKSGEGTVPSARVAFDRESDPRLVAWCGASMPGLARMAGQLGWTGLEGLVGVPGSLGGGLAMNAGGRWGEVWDAVERVMVLDPKGELRELARGDCAPAYRDGNLGANIAVGAVLALEVDSIPAVKERSREFLLEKNAVQPVSLASAGCIFKNPDPDVSDGRTAGQLVDQCGGKGRRRGAAQVSELHGNFIVNTGGARANDVLELIRDVQELVAQRTGVLLEVEVRRW